MAPTRPLSLNKSNGLRTPERRCFLSLFRQTACSASASIHFNTLKVRKIYSYSESRKFVKTRIVHHLLLSNSVQTACHETGVSNRSNSFTKITYTGAYMILDTQIFIPSPKAVKLQVCNLTSVSLDAIFLFAHVPNT